MAGAFTNWFARIPRETKVAAVVLAVALLQVGVLAALGLDRADRRLDDAERSYRERGERTATSLAIAASDVVARKAADAADEIARDGGTLPDRALQALRRAHPFSSAYTIDADGAVRDVRRPPFDATIDARLDAAAASRRDDDARARIAALLVLADRDPASAIDAARALADDLERRKSPDAVAVALALQCGARAALVRNDTEQALRFARRILSGYRTVRDDRGALGEREPFGLAAAATACEALLRTVPTGGDAVQAEFADAILDRRAQVQRFLDGISPAAARIEREECTRLRNVALGLAPGPRATIDGGLRAADAIDAGLARMASLPAPALAAAARASEAQWMRLPDGALVAVVPAPRGGGATAVAFVAERAALVGSAVAPAFARLDPPPGLRIVVRDESGAVVAGDAKDVSPRTQPLVVYSLGNALPGLRAEAWVADRAAMAAETESARTIWLWVLATAGLAVVAASLLAVRAVLREVRLARMKSDFVSNLSHELRTPLTSLRMFVETLQEGRVRDEQEARECIDVVAQETERLSSFVDRILTFSSFEKGRAPIERKPEDPADVARRAADVFRKRAESAGAKLILDAPAGLPPAHLDRDAVIQVLLNLLDNAVKYGRDNGGTIRLSVRAEGAETVYLVEDDGPGVPERERGLVFEEFYRGDDTLSRRRQGAGIGLALCRRIVLAHGGRIGVLASKSLGGAAFRVALPAVPATAAAPEAAR